MTVRTTRRRATRWRRCGARGTTTLDGFRVLWVGVKREPRVFTVATLGAVLFGVLTVADAWVLGWSTQHVLIPAFDTGEIGTDMLVWVFVLFMSVAILRAIGIVARRLGGGIMYYRMQSHTRRGVTRQYLALPMEWHQRHPTGQLLSNAYSDVEAAWSPIMPLPMALGTVVMMVVAVVQMFVADVVMAIVGLLVFPAVVVANLLYQRYASPLMTRAQGLRAEVSEIAHESFDGAMVVKTLGREVEETDRFRAKAHELRDVNIRAGRIRAIFDPALASLPGLGVLVVLAVGVSRVTSGATSAGDVVTIAYLLTIVSFPIRAIGWLLGEFPRSVVGYRRAKAVLDATGAMPYGPDELPRTEAGALLQVEDLHYSYDPDDPLLRGLDLEVRPGRTVALVGATASGKSTLTSLLSRLVDPDAGAHPDRRPRPAHPAQGRAAARRRAGAADRVHVRRHRPRQRHPRRRRPRRGGVERAAHLAGRRLRRRPARRASTPSWGSAAPRCPAASASGCRSPARSYAARGC